MINKTYTKRCNGTTLVKEIIAAGLVLYPNAGARFYGVNCDQQPDGTSWITTVMVYDDFTAGETTILDAVVAAHIPTVTSSSPILVEETQIFTNEAIRDTNAHTSSVSANIGYRVKTLIITNTLDQAVTKQCQASRDSTNWFNIGDSFIVLAGATVYQSCETYFPYVRAIATCASSPTTGNLNMWIEKMGV